ncbi:MAG TPA: class I SAM-dependent methyltransferase [Gaiellaceae bacterium]
MRRGDAFGQALVDHLDGKATHVVLERDDGTVGPEALAWYFNPLRKWRPAERQALRFARGRCVDIGAGAGRVSLVLQERGREVVAVDVSDGARGACARRGVHDVRPLGFDDLEALGPFDTAVLFGGNVGLLESAARARRRLRLLHRLTSGRGRVLLSGVVPEETDDPLHLAYHERNRLRGRLPGQLRLRVRYRDLTTGWIDWLFVSPAELAALAEPAGWSVSRVIPGADHVYAAVLDKR